MWLVIMSSLCCGMPLPLLDETERLSLNPTLLIWFCNNSHKTSSLTPFLCKYFAVEGAVVGSQIIKTGLLLQRTDVCPNTMQCHQSLISNNVPYLHSTSSCSPEAFTNCLINPTSWEEAPASHRVHFQAVEIPRGKGPFGLILGHWLREGQHSK